MIKSELIIKLFEKQTNFLLDDIEQGMNAVLRYMGDAIANGSRIEIRGFGNFSCHYHAPRKARNPRTGKIFYTEGRNKPHFKPGKDLKVRVNANRDNAIIKN